MLERCRSIHSRAWLLPALASLVFVASAQLGQDAAAAVILDDEDVLTFVLEDGTSVTLYAQAQVAPARAIGRARPDVRALAAETVGAPGADRDPGGAAPPPAHRAAGPRRTQRFQKAAKQTSKTYYYLPANLRLSRRPDGTPEFLFLRFTTEEREAQGGASGAILHFLMEWGLTPQQQEELRGQLEERVPGAKLAGAVPMEPAGETGTFRVLSATLEDESMTRSLVTTGKAPLVPGGKAAAASRLSANGAQLLAASFERARSITDVTIYLDFQYQTLTPAANGSITFNWDKFQADHSIQEAEYSAELNKAEGRCGPVCRYFRSRQSRNYTYTYDEMSQFYSYLQEEKYVEVSFVETYSDERVDKIREAFFDYFLQSMTDVEPPPAPEEEQEPEEVPDVRQGTHYKFNSESLSAAYERKTDRFDLNYRLAVRRPHQLEGNLASWYDHVRDNPRCVASVNLNDPFFQHRDIRFILDLDAKEMFDQAVNYVTVNVRKLRRGERPFEDRATIDAKYVQEHGITATVTYARGSDAGGDAYQYQAQWSLKGGHVYPPNPQWVEGSWEGVTLSPPVVPRTVEFEADLGELEANEVTRATAQVRYWKFGEEGEENLHISLAQGEPLVAKQIFTDRDARGYAYRVILNHKREGKLVVPSREGNKDGWNAQLGDNYVFAVLPPDLFSEPAKTAEAKDAASELLTSTRAKVLDRFKELLP